MYVKLYIMNPDVLFNYCRDPVFCIQINVPPCSFYVL